MTDVGDVFSWMGCTMLVLSLNPTAGTASVVVAQPHTGRHWYKEQQLPLPEDAQKLVRATLPGSIDPNAPTLLDKVRAAIHFGTPDANVTHDILTELKTLLDGNPQHPVIANVIATAREDTALTRVKSWLADEIEEECGPRQESTGVRRATLEAVQKRIAQLEAMS